MTRKRGLLYHFTHITNLASIAENGLCCDAQIEAGDRTPTEVGNADVTADEPDRMERRMAELLSRCRRWAAATAGWTGTKFGP